MGFCRVKLLTLVNLFCPIPSTPHTEGAHVGQWITHFQACKLHHTCLSTLCFNNKIATVIESGTDRQTDRQTDEGRHVKPPLSGRDLIMPFKEHCMKYVGVRLALSGMSR